MCRRKGKSGFTLVEVVVAVVILIGIAVTVAGFTIRSGQTATNIAWRDGAQTVAKTQLDKAVTLLEMKRGDSDTSIAPKEALQLYVAGTEDDTAGNSPQNGELVLASMSNTKTAPALGKTASAQQRNDLTNQRNGQHPLVVDRGEQKNGLWTNVYAVGPIEEAVRQGGLVPGDAKGLYKSLAGIGGMMTYHEDTKTWSPETTSKQRGYTYTTTTLASICKIGADENENSVVSAEGSCTEPPADWTQWSPRMNVPEGAPNNGTLALDTMVRVTTVVTWNGGGCNGLADGTTANKSEIKPSCMAVSSKMIPLQE